MLQFWILLLLCHIAAAIRNASVSSPVLGCVGDNITFDLTYVTERGERARLKSFIWISMDRGTIVSFFNGRLLAPSNRFKFDPSSGLTLTHLRTEDTGNYTVTATENRKAARVRLMVLEPPQTVIGRLEVFQNFVKVSTGVNCQLKCGHFISRGTPPVSVVWKNPDGDEIPSTEFADGFFALHLPSQFKEGNYSCRLDRNSSATQCLVSDNPLFRDSVITVDKGLARIEKEPMEAKKQPKELRGERDPFDRHDLAEVIRLQKVETHNQTGQVAGSVHRDIALLKEIVHDINATMSRQDTIIKQQEALILSLAQNLSKFQTDFQHRYKKTKKLHRKFTDSESRQMKFSQDLENRIRVLEMSQTKVKTVKGDLHGHVKGLMGNNSQLDAANTKLLADVNQTQKTHNDSIFGSELLLREELTTLGKKQQELRQELSSEMQDLRRNFSDLRSSMNAEALSLHRDLEAQKTKVASVWKSTRQNFTIINSKLRDVRRDQDRKLQSLRSDHQAFSFRYSNLTTTIKQKAQENLTHREENWGKLQDDSSKLRDLEARLDRLETQQDEMNRNVTNDFNNLTDRQLELSAHLESGKEKCLLMEARLQGQLSSLNATLKRQLRVGLKGKDQTNNAVLWQLRHDVSVLQSQQLADKTALTNLTTSNQNQIKSLRKFFRVTTDRMFRSLRKATLQQIAKVRSTLGTRLNALTKRMDAGDIRNRGQHVQRLPRRLYPGVRLVGGRSAREGRVEVLNDNTWGTVCDDDWDDVDAGVVCFSLGFSRKGAKAVTNAKFGQGSGPILLDNVGCTGGEANIRFCKARPLGTHNCDHSEDAGVICQP